MKWPELTPSPAPLPCFAVEFEESDPECQGCPHNARCQQYMLGRRHRIPLSRAAFQVLPEAYEVRFNVEPDDPEAPELERVYILCHQTIFGAEPDKPGLGRFRQAIIDSARKADCSVRLFMLANMMAHQKMQEERVAKTSLARVTHFKPYRLAEPQALERARMYAELCRKQFGTFTLSSLSALSEVNLERTDVETKLLDSEVTAGRWLVGHKIFHGGPPYELFYHCEEQNLDPTWLAIEDSYKTVVLDKQQTGSREQLRHRFSVKQSIGFLKRNRSIAVATFLARQTLLPEAVNKVLEHYGFTPADFEVEDKPIVDPLQMWVHLGRAIQHFNLINYLHGGASLFNPR